MTIDTYYYRSKYEKYLDKFKFNQKLGIVSQNEQPLIFEEWLANKININV